MEKKAEAFYRKYLEGIEGVVGQDSTYASDLDRVGRSLFGECFKGVFPSDMVPRMSVEGDCCILNLDRSDQAGSHWVAVVLLRTGTVLFYDSFGRPNRDIIGMGDYTVEDTDLDAEQTTSQRNCGARCLSFLAVFHENGAQYAKLI